MNNDEEKYFDSTQKGSVIGELKKARQQCQQEAQETDKSQDANAENANRASDKLEPTHKMSHENESEGIGR